MILVEKNPITRCDRCGIDRVGKHGEKRKLCRDCRYTLTPEQARAWVA